MKPWLIFPFPTAFSIMHLIWSLSDNSQWISLLMCVLVYSQGADISGWLLKKRIKLGCFFFFLFAFPHSYISTTIFSAFAHCWLYPHQRKWPLVFCLHPDIDLRNIWGSSSFFLNSCFQKRRVVLSCLSLLAHSEMSSIIWRHERCPGLQQFHRDLENCNISKGEG